MYSVGSIPADGTIRTGTDDQKCVRVYTDLLKLNTIRVIFDLKQGLFAYVCPYNPRLNSSKEPQRLPLSGLPKEIAKETDLTKLIQFFAYTYLVPQKSVEGVYSRVSAHISGEGGGRSLIPFQPGLALGSVFRGELLDKMEEYADIAAQRERYEEQIRTSAQRLELLNEQIKELEAVTNRNPAQNALLQIYKQELEEITQLLKDIVAKIPKGTAPMFPVFQQAVESPIDMGKSKFEVQPRGFDSLDWNSKYFRKSTNVAEIHAMAKEASSSHSVAATGGFTIFGARVGPQGGHAWSSAVADRVSNLLQKEGVQGILVINATVTTRNVRCITERHYDLEKLHSVQTAMKGSDAASLERYGISTVKGEKRLYLLTEAVLGGAFTALITFSDASDSSRDSSMHSDASSSTTSGGVGVSWGFINFGFDLESSSSSASKREDDVLKGIATTRINIEVHAQGAIPAMTRQVIEHEIFKKLNLDKPAELQNTEDDEEIVKGLTSDDKDERKAAAIKQNIRLQKDALKIATTYRAMTTATEKQNVHTLETVMTAYENFAAQITKDSDCGIPVGFNYAIMTQAEIDKKVKSLETKLKLKEKAEVAALRRAIDDGGSAPSGSTSGTAGSGSTSYSPDIRPTDEEEEKELPPEEEGGS